MYIKIPTILLFFYYLLCLYRRNIFLFVKINPLICEILVFNGGDVEIYNFFKQLEIAHISVIKKSRIIVIKDTFYGRIYKYSFGESIREIENNFYTLKKIQNLPSPIGVRLIKGVCGVLSSEKLISGREVSLSDLNINIYKDFLYENICTILQKFHYQTIQRLKFDVNDEMDQYDFLIKRKNKDNFDKVKSNLLLNHNSSGVNYAYKAKIHGDVTYRNIIIDNKNIFFIDFERSSFDFPEFDFINFILDFNVHSSKSTSYKSYIDYLVDIYIEKKYIKIFNKLELSGRFKSKNTDILNLIYLKYLIRQVAIVTNVSYYEKYIDINSIYKSINNKIRTKRGGAHDYR